MGTLINILDERDSKLRQLQGTLKEQMEQWQRSISDLQVDISELNNTRSQCEHIFMLS